MTSKETGKVYTYEIDYVVGNTYKYKRVKATTVSEALKRARLNKSVVDINIVDELPKDEYLLRDF